MVFVVVAHSWSSFTEEMVSEWQWKQEWICQVVGLWGIQPDGAIVCSMLVGFQSSVWGRMCESSSL